MSYFNHGFHRFYLCPQGTRIKSLKINRLLEKFAMVFLYSKLLFELFFGGAPDTASSARSQESASSPNFSLLNR